MLAAEIRIKVAFRDFGTPGDLERAGLGITVFGEGPERGPEDALLHRTISGGPIGDDGLSHGLSLKVPSGTL
jgi:hypothetical protein